MNQLISVIIPIFKVEPYLCQCIDSILFQTYTALEVILVDDGSPDQCGVICDNYSRKDARIKVIHKSNGGISDARNVAIDMARGDYLMFVDSDDWVEPTYCERAVEAAKLYDADIVAFRINFISESGVVTSNHPLSSVFLTVEESISFPYSFPWNKIYRRRLFDQIRYPKGKTYEDQAVTYLLIHKANGVYVINDRTYNYRRRPDSTTSNEYTEQKVIDRFEIWLCRLIFLDKFYPSLSVHQIQKMTTDIAKGLCIINKNEDVKKEIELFLIQNKLTILNLHFDKFTSFLLKLYYHGGLSRFLYYNLIPVIFRFKGKIRHFICQIYYLVFSFFSAKYILQMEK